MHENEHIKVIIGIGASTGGTEAIIEVVKDFPQDMPPILIVQHMPKVFTKMYAERLDKICKMNVKEAVDCDSLQNGIIFIAPGSKQMIVTPTSYNKYVIRCVDGERVSGHIPSVDVLFESIAKIKNVDKIGVIMTGMGSDGAKGLLDIKNSGGYTIGQDKNSSVVYGMSMVANQYGAVQKELTLLNISKNIMKHLKL